MSETKPHSAVHSSNFVAENGGGSAEGGVPNNGKDKKKVRNINHAYIFLGNISRRRLMSAHMSVKNEVFFAICA